MNHSADRLESRCLLAAPHPFNLGTILNGDGSAGFALFGNARSDNLGRATDKPADINGDGYDDLLTAANLADPNGSFSGEAYVVFGKPGGFAATSLISALDGTNGFTLQGNVSRKYLGETFSGVGDVNGDGFHDVVYGAPLDDIGEAFVLFGKADGFPSTLVTTQLDGTNGFALNGGGPHDAIGNSVSGGDVNGDGYGDLLIGTDLTAGLPSTGPHHGRVQVIFGSPNGFPAAFDLTALNGTNGFEFVGPPIGDRIGFSVSTADVNADGFDDMIMGGVNADGAKVFVVYGRSSGFSPSVDLDQLSQSDGFIIEGVKAGDSVVSAAGDVNGDGFEDILIGADRADAGDDTDVGEAYIIFGTATGFPLQLNVSALDGTNGFALQGVNADDRLSRRNGAGIGDVNADGYDDIMLGAGANDATGTSSGQAYVIFGSPNSFPAVLRMADLNGTNGFHINPESYVINFVGTFVGPAGDINGDGFDDFSVSAHGEDHNGSNTGTFYTIFGDDFLDAVTHRGDAADNMLAGDAGANSIVGGQGNDILIGHGGADVLRGGQGNDVIAISDLSYLRVDGGRGLDTLRLDGASMSLTPAAIFSTRLSGFEAIDLRGDSDHMLTLDVLSVIGISDTSNTLMVYKDAGDTVSIGSGWSQGSNESIGDDTFEVYTQGAATLKVQTVPVTVDLVATAFNAVPDHVLFGQTDVTFTVMNTGLTAAGNFETQIIWSRNNIVGDADDMVVSGGNQTFPGLAGGANASRTVNLQLDQSMLFAHAKDSTPGGGSVGTVSTESSHLFLIVDSADEVTESSEINNFGQGNLIDRDDITYFPWDKNGNGAVEPLEALSSIQSIGTTDAASDFNGDGIVSPLEALSSVQRIGYVRSSDSEKVASKAGSVPGALTQNSQSTATIPTTPGLLSSGLPATVRQAIGKQTKSASVWIYGPESLPDDDKGDLFNSASVIRERDVTIRQAEIDDSSPTSDQVFSDVRDWLALL